MKKLAKSIATLVVAAASLGTSASAEAALGQNQVFEVRFMKDMIDHHDMAVDTSRLCLDRASHGELLELCKDMLESQREEISRMQGWLKAWYEETSTPHETEHGRRDMEHLASLSGSQFEMEFMQMMVGHHAVAVEQSAECLVRSAHGSLTALCTNIARTQAVEIRSMRTWLCQWYEACSLHVMRSMMVGVPQR